MKAINRVIAKRYDWYFDRNAIDKSRPSEIHNKILSSLLKISRIAIYVAPATEKFKEASGTIKNPPEKKKKGEIKYRIAEMVPACFE